MKSRNFKRLKPFLFVVFMLPLGYSAMAARDAVLNDCFRQLKIAKEILKKGASDLRCKKLTDIDKLSNIGGVCKVGLIPDEHMTIGQAYEKCP